MLDLPEIDMEVTTDQSYSTPPWQIAIDCNIVILGDSNTAIGGDDCSKSVGWNKWFRDMLSPASCRSYARSGEAVHKDIPEKHDETLRTGKPHRLSLQLAGSLSAWKGWWGVHLVLHPLRAMRTGKDKTLAVLNLPDIHTLNADGLSTQFVGYLFSNSLTTVVHDDDWFMFHNPTKVYLRLTPLHREHSAGFRKRQVFRLSSTPRKRYML